jgi:FkbM family methyltransferase
MDESMIEITTEWGDSLLIRANDRSHYPEFLLTGVEWPIETCFLLDHVHHGMTVVDLGAKYGYCTTFFAHHVGPSGQVLAVEPDQGNFALLERNICRNGYANIILKRAAVGERSGPQSLWISKTHLSSHSLFAENVRDLAGDSTVDVVTLDDMVADLLPNFSHIDLLKVDVEGAEGTVINGGWRGHVRRVL